MNNVKSLFIYTYVYFFSNDLTNSFTIDINSDPSHSSGPNKRRDLLT